MPVPGLVRSLVKLAPHGLRSLLKLAPLTTLAWLGSPGCGGQAAPGAAPADDDLEAVEESKADNYRGTNAREFLATATASVTLDAAFSGKPESERRAAAEELVSARLLQIGWFLNLWVLDKEPEDSNKDYGGFHAMARTNSVKSLEVKPKSELEWSFNFEATLAAQNDLLRVMPGATEGGKKRATLKLAKLDNASLLAAGWKGYDVHSWNGDKEDAASVEALPIVVEAAPRSSNAFLNYAALMADGKLTVGAQFGWDYNEGRADLANARQLYDDLLGLGFQSPVTKYEDLKLGSGPLKRTARYGEKTVTVEVTLIHPGMIADPAANAKQLRDALLDLLATREVILFNGHAGTSGRLLPGDFHASSAGNILPTEYATLALPASYQLLLIEGCQTYARFTDGFRANPSKRGPHGELKNMDIVTSTSYTWTSQGAESMEAILFPLVGKDARKALSPATWDDVLRTMNAPPSTTAFMGVNGIDDDPHGHPYGNAARQGRSCSSAAQCGGEGNVCLRPRAGAAKVCAPQCIDDAGCSGGSRCAPVSSSTRTEPLGACVAR